MFAIYSCLEFSRMNFGEVRAFGDFPLYRQAGWDSAQMGKIPFLLLTLGFTVAVFYFEFYLDLRQWGKFFNNPKLPDQLKNVVNAETFEKSIAYRKDTFSFKIFESLFGFGLGIAFVLAGYLPFLWDLATHLVGRAGLLTTSYSVMFQEIVITWLFVILMTLIDTLTSLPFNLYSTFVVEQKHGFNKSTLGLFIQDKLMTLGLTFVISFPVLGAIVYLVRIGGPYFYFYVWFFLFLFSLVMMTIYPTLIAPLFNKYTKLEDGPVKTAIEDLAKQVSFPLTNLFSVDGSKRSGHSNAYFYGFFKNKRIVLYDTLLKQVELPELLAILGHEIGHWKLWHTIQGLAIAQMYTFCLFLAFSYVQNTPGLFVAFGFNYTSPMPVFVGLMLFVQTFWSPVEKVSHTAITTTTTDDVDYAMYVNIVVVFRCCRF